jgi:hypothetical protein
MDGRRLTSPQIPQLARSAPSLGMTHAFGTVSVSFRREASGLIVIPSERSESRDLPKLLNVEDGSLSRFRGSLHSLRS